MKNLKGVSLALLSVLTISLMINGVQTLIIPPVKHGSIAVTSDDDKVTVENDLVKIVISRGGGVGGVRVVEWTILETGLELAANAKPAGAIGNRYPLWDWIPNQEWPGEICLGDYDTNATDGTYTGSVSISFEYTCTETPIAGLQVIKILTFHQDKYYFDMKIILRNPTTGDISTAATWNPNVGYNINTVGYLEPVAKLYQGYQDGEVTTLDQNVGWERRPAAQLRWIAIYNRETGAIMAMSISEENATNSVWLEGGRGAWGSETRVEFVPQTISPGAEVAYVLKVFGGPPDLPQLTEIGMGNLASGLAFSAEMDSDKFVYSLNDTCRYFLNLTNGLTEPFTDVEVNLTLWTSDQYGELKKKVSDVKYWPTFTIDPRSTLPLEGSLRFNKTAYYGLYAQIYKEGSLTSDLVLLTPVLAELDPEKQVPLTACFVWNLNQPIVMDEKGDFRRNFVHDTVEEGPLYTEGTPYLLHAELLKKHTKINVTFNLQPSLLYQWNMTAYNNWILYWWNAVTGFAHWDPAEQPPSVGSREAIEGFKELAAKGQIELLASPFYSPLMPILLAKGWTSDIEDQLNMGKDYIQDLMDVNPTGLWIPEMAFNMSLVPIINNTGLQYTVLDHRMLEAAVSPRSISYEPWYVKDPQTNKTVVAFFRARYLDVHWEKDDLCNRLETKWSTDPRHSEATRELILYLNYLWRTHARKKSVVTIAVDEWVSTGGPAAPNTLEDFYSAIEQCSSWLKLATLKSALDSVPPTQTVTNLPEGSWTNATSIDDWVGEFNSTDSRLNMTYWLWNTTEAARNRVMEYAGALSAEERAADENLKLAMKYIYIAEASCWYKTADDEFSQEQVERYTESAVKTLFPEFDVWKAYGVYIITGCFVAVVALAAVWAYRRRRIKPAP